MTLILIVVDFTDILDRVWRMANGDFAETVLRDETDDDREMLAAVHRTLRKVTDDIDRFTFNTAVAALMELANTLSSYLRGGGRTETMRESIRLILLMLSPMAPHMAHELWERGGYGGMLATQPWPEWDPNLVRRDVATMVVQINGKVRDRIEVSADIDAAEAERIALELDKIRPWLDGVAISKVISRPPGLVNIVVD